MYTYLVNVCALEFLFDIEANPENKENHNNIIGVGDLINSKSWKYVVRVNIPYIVVYSYILNGCMNKQLWRYKTEKLVYLVVYSCHKKDC